MSEPATVADKAQEVEAFAAEHRAAGPETVSSDALGRVRDEARRKARSGGSAHAARLRRGYRIAGVAAAAALVVGVVAYSMTPHVDDSAFARQQAIASLLPKGEVLHSRATLTGTGRTDEYGEGPSSATIIEDWVDVERGVSRSESKDVGDGKLGELTIRNGDVTRTWAANFAIDLKKMVSVRLKTEQLIQRPSMGELTSPAGALVEQLRTALGSGEAKVVDRVKDGADEYWVVRWTVPPYEKNDEPTEIKATLRTSDYALRGLEISDRGKNGNGNWEGTSVWEYDTWEAVSRSSLPSDTFSLDAPLKIAKPGTKIEYRKE